jgi:hypothetical protein
MQDLYKVHLLPCTHQDFIWLSARHFAVHGGKFLLALFIFNLSSSSVLQAVAKRGAFLSQIPTGKC